MRTARRPAGTRMVVAAKVVVVERATPLRMREAGVSGEG